MKKILLTLLSLAAFSLFLTTAPVKAAGQISDIKVTPSNPKAGEQVEVTFTVSDLPDTAGQVNLYISDISQGIENAEATLKRSYNPFAYGESSTFTYTWDTGASNPGDYNIHVAILTEKLPREILASKSKPMQLAEQNDQAESDKNEAEESAIGEEADLNGDGVVDESERKAAEGTKSGAKGGGGIPLLGQILPSGDPASWKLADVRTLVLNILNLLTTLAGVIAFGFIIYGAYQYFTAFGSEERAAAAKKTITYAVVGVVIILLSRVIINEVWRFVSGSNLKF